MPACLYRRILSWYKADRNRSLAVIAGISVFILGAGAFMSDYVQSKTEITGLPRNGYGQGKRTEELEVYAEGGDKEKNIEVEISERAYTEEEIKELFVKCINKLDTLILGANKSPDHIEENMELVTEIPGEPVAVSWELDRYDVMNVYGEINEESLKEMQEEQGIMVKLQAVLTYREKEDEQALYESTVMVYPKRLSEEDRTYQAVQRELKKSDERSRTKEVLTLPEETEGKKLHFYRKMDNRGSVLMVMAVIIFLLLYALKWQNQEKEAEKRRRQMSLDYPEIVSKLTLLLGAGMTVKRAWRKIVSDYDVKSSRDRRYAFEEMKYTCREMESGITESESYERFGKRCGIQEYIRLGALLSQNLRKGTKGLGDLLRLEAVQAFEERKARAKRLGEEAGTKLLMPMFLMLAVVLVIVIVPAFLSIQI